MKLMFKNYGPLFGSIAVLVVAIMIWSSRSGEFPLLKSRIARAEKQQADLNKNIARQQDLIRQKTPVLMKIEALRRDSFVKSGNVVADFRSRVEQSFSAAGAQVRTMGTPRQLKGIDDIALYEISLTADLTTAELNQVMIMLNQPPRILWRNVSLRPNKMLNPQFMNLNVTLACAAFDPLPGTALEAADE